MAEFMVLIRGGDDVYQAMNPEEAQAAIQKYIDWDNQLRQQGRYVVSNELAQGGAVVRNEQEQLVVDGPFAETIVADYPEKLGERFKLLIPHATVRDPNMNED